MPIEPTCQCRFAVLIAAQRRQCDGRDSRAPQFMTQDAEKEVPHARGFRGEMQDALCWPLTTPIRWLAARGYDLAHDGGRRFVWRIDRQHWIAPGRH